MALIRQYLDKQFEWPPLTTIPPNIFIESWTKRSNNLYGLWSLTMLLAHVPHILVSFTNYLWSRKFPSRWKFACSSISSGGTTWSVRGNETQHDCDWLRGMSLQSISWVVLYAIQSVLSYWQLVGTRCIDSHLIREESCVNREIATPLCYSCSDRPRA